jgi:hypothetical protein
LNSRYKSPEVRKVPEVSKRGVELLLEPLRVQDEVSKMEEASIQPWVLSS